MPDRRGCGCLVVQVGEVDGPKSGGMISWPLENSVALVLNIPSVVFKDCAAVMVTELGDGEQILAFHVWEEVGVCCSWR